MSESPAPSISGLYKVKKEAIAKQVNGYQKNKVEDTKQETKPKFLGGFFSNRWTRSVTQDQQKLMSDTTSPETKQLKPSKFGDSVSSLQHQKTDPTASISRKAGKLENLDPVLVLDTVSSLETSYEESQEDPEQNKLVEKKNCQREQIILEQLEPTVMYSKERIVPKKLFSREEAGNKSF